MFLNVKKYMLNERFYVPNPLTRTCLLVGRSNSVGVPKSAAHWTGIAFDCTEMNAKEEPMTLLAIVLLLRTML